MKVYEYGEFEDLLEQAELNASKNWDINFVSDISDKFSQFGEDMYISDSQITQLERIAGV